MNELWNTLAARGNLTLDSAQHDRLSKYLDLLIEANATMNLTRIVDRAAAQALHIGDALTLLPFLPAGSIALADVGTGGGVPGIPLAIVRPDISITLIESTKKKAAFLQRAAAELGLANVRVSADAPKTSACPIFARHSTWRLRGRWRRSIGWPSGACRS